jgi:polyhydroxybutyrate depolymerase
MAVVNFSGRTYHYHLPGGIDPASPAPVVLVLHALGINGDTMEWATGLSALADREGFVAVYPDAAEGANPGLPLLPDHIRFWNAGGIFSSAAATDDVAFLDKVLDSLEKQAKVDSKRTYVVGMSNGGMMAYKLAAELSGRFAAMAAVAGMLLTTEFKPTVAAMPVLHFHGTADPIVKYDGEDWHPSVEASMAACARFNDCSLTPKMEKLQPENVPLAVEKLDYGKGTQGAEVVLYRVLGGGHTWPNQQPIPGFQDFLGAITPNIDANQTIWDFFKKYSLPETRP